MPATRRAETRKVEALRTRLTSRPKATVARPPTAAPMKSMVPQTLPRVAWAMGSSSGGTTLGTEASATGSKKEERAASRATQEMASTGERRRREASRPRAGRMRSRSTVTMRRLRSTRSAMRPARGDKRKTGRTLAAKTAAAEPGRPVDSVTKPLMAT
ncbi:hypothetical protein OV287_53520 [Archangium sp. miwbw1]|uniref:Uncharacterized protein n=1 Tax=Archangium lansingense TaxID=2995310 RepID=A0ABT4ANL2_9BACT|nr:hypothetical protein [Archangium lansinium]MCY1083288.1 hypothetical protein [Archangium lansinium]